jgi:hypothetical protein
VVLALVVRQYNTDLFEPELSAGARALTIELGTHKTVEARLSEQIGVSRPWLGTLFRQKKMKPFDFIPVSLARQRLFNNLRIPR